MQRGPVPAPTRGALLNHAPAASDFEIVGPNRIVERAFAWLGRHRRLSNDREVRVPTSEDLVTIAACTLMLNASRRAEPSSSIPFERGREAVALIGGVVMDIAPSYPLGAQAARKGRLP